MVCTQRAVYGLSNRRGLTTTMEIVVSAIVLDFFLVIG